MYKCAARKWMKSRLPQLLRNSLTATVYLHCVCCGGVLSQLEGHLGGARDLGPKLVPKAFFTLRWRQKRLFSPFQCDKRPWGGRRRAPSESIPFSCFLSKDWLTLCRFKIKCTFMYVSMKPNAFFNFLTQHKNGQNKVPKKYLEGQASKSTCLSFIKTSSVCILITSYGSFRF